MKFFIVKKIIITKINHYFIYSDCDINVKYYVKKKKLSFPIKKGNIETTYSIFIDKYEKGKNEISFLSKSGSYFIPINGEAEFIY